MIPQKISGLDHQKIIQLACGFDFCLALTSRGKVYSFGDNSFGQLGHGDNQPLRGPKKIKSLPVKITSIAAGTFTSLALDKNGHTWTWGADIITPVSYDPEEEKNKCSLVRFNLDVTIETIGSGPSFSGALSTEGDLYLWGQAGDFGFGDSDECPSPRKVSEFTEKISQFCCGGSHVLALSEFGTLYSWGVNGRGQLGLGFISFFHPTPEIIPFDFGDKITTIAAGYLKSMAFTRDGRIFVWGGSRLGTLGHGGVETQSLPRELALPASPKVFRKPHPILHLFNSEIYSDIEIAGKKFHRCIIHARCPNFFDIDISGYSTPVVHSALHFIYSNSPDSFSGLTLEQISESLKLCRCLGMDGALSACQRLFLVRLDPETAFHVLLKISEFGLTEEIEWVLWYIGKNNISPLLELLGRLGSEIPVLFLRSIEERLNPTLLPPKISELRPPIRDDLKNLFISGNFSDFQLSVGSEMLRLHKWVLSSWEFSRILFHDQTHSLHMPIETFKKILLFFYTLEIPKLTFADAVYISSFSEFYLLKKSELFKYCEDKASRVRSKNWVEAFILGTKWGNEGMKSAARRVAPSLDGLQMLEELVQEAKGKHESN
jgi:hypothetical protein